MSEPAAGEPRSDRASASTAGDAKNSGLRRALRWAGLAALALAFWCLRFMHPVNNLSIELDPSWQRAYAYFFEHRLQAGVDYVFTFGPLGCLQNLIYHADVFWLRVLASEVVFEIAAAVLLVRVWLRVPGIVERALFATLVIMNGVMYELGPFTTIAAAGALLFDPTVSRRWHVLAALLLTGLALVKFNYLVLAAVCAFAVAWSLARQRSPRAALSWVALVALVFLASWMLCGQSLANLPAYLWTSLQIVRGYSEAMGRPIPTDLLALAGATFAIGALYVAVRWRLASAPRAWELLLVSAGLVFAFKSTFVQHIESGTFFAFASLAPFLFDERTTASAAPRARLAIRATKLAWIATAMVGIPGLSRGSEKLQWWFARVPAQISATVDLLTHLPDSYAELVKNDEKLAKQFDLPRVRERVGSEPLDLVSVNQSVLLVNGFTYRPRPVFQSYAAYTPALAALNERFYASERAPRFVLVRLQPGGELLPAMEDGATLEVLLRDYEVLFAERGFLLLERLRRTPLAAPSADRGDERSVRIGDLVELGAPPAGSRRLFAEIHPTLQGRARALLLHAADVKLELTLTSGETSTYRVLPSLLREGVLLDPLIRDHDDVKRWFGGLPIQRVAALRFVVAEDERDQFDPEVRLRVVLDGTLPPPEARPAQPALLYSMFATVPDAVQARPEPKSTIQWNREVLLVGSPSTMSFGVGAGAHRVTAKFGILRKASLIGRTLGVTFRVALRTESGEVQPLFERALDPRGTTDDIGMQDLDLEFRADGPAQLLLTTEPRVRDRAEWNWAYWTETRIENR